MFSFDFSQNCFYKKYFVANKMNYQKLSTHLFYLIDIFIVLILLLDHDLLLDQPNLKSHQISLR